MAAQSLLAKLGCRLATLGSAASLAFAFPIAEGDQSMSAHTAANRIGTYADRTGGAEKVGHVVMGTEVLSVGVASISAAVQVRAPAGTTAAASLNLGQGVAPTTPANGDVWVTSAGMFVRAGGATAGPFAAGGGGVTSVGLALPAIFTVSGTPVTTSGTLTGTLANQNANLVWAGPATGVPAAPTFRSLVVADIPNLPTSQLTSGQLTAARGGTGVDGSAAGNGTLLIGNGAGYTLASLTAGTNVTITPGAGSITINAALSGAITGSLTSGRVPYASGTTTLTDSATMTYDGHKLVLGGAVTDYGQLVATDDGNTASTSLSVIATGVAASRQNLVLWRNGGLNPNYAAAAGMSLPTVGLSDDYIVSQFQAVGYSWLQTLRAFGPTRNVIIGTGSVDNGYRLEVGGAIKTAASTTAQASLNVPAGAAPTAPNDGDIWATTAGVFARVNGGTVGPFAAAGGSVASVALALPAIFTVSGSPVTSTGTLTGTLATQTANLVWAGPATGVPATPTFRSLVAADVPNLPASQITSGQLTVTRGGTGVDGSAAGNGTLLIGNGTGYTLASLTAGSNITITPGAGTITIAAAISGGITGTLTSGRVPFANGASSLTDSSTFTFSTASGLSVNRPGTTGTECFGSGAGNTTMSAQNATLVGLNAGASLAASGSCTFIGANAGTALSAGSGSNTAVGANALLGLTSGSTNVALGDSAGKNMTTGASCCWIGSQAGLRMFNGGTNIGIGSAALLGSATVANNTGTRMIVIGNAVQGNTSASRCVVIGNSSGALLSTGSDNIFIGDSAGITVVAGTGNIFLGSGADGGSDLSNTLIIGGTSAISATYTGNGVTSATPTSCTHFATGGNGANIAGASYTIVGGIGTGTGVGGAIILATAPVSGNSSTPNTQTTRLSILGDGGVKWTGIATTSAPATAAASTGVIFYDSTLQKFRYSVNTGAYADLVSAGGITGTLTSGRVPFANGTSTLTDSSTFTFSTASGLSVNRAGLTGCEFFGSGAGNTSITGNGQNTFVGNGAGNGFVTGDRTVAVGFNALAACTTSSRNVAIGYQAMAAVTLSASDNVAIGYNSQFASTGNVQCVSIGSGTMTAANAKSNCTAVGCTAMGANAGNNNTGIGASAMDTVTSGGSNTALGMSAGSGMLSGSFNIFLGRESGDSTTNSASNRLVAGSSTSAIASVFIGNGEVHATPQAVVYKATGGVGADITGASFTIAGGIGTGAGLGGNIIFQVAPASGSSSTPNTLTTGLTINQRKTVDFAFGFVAGIRTTTTTDTAVNTDFTILADTTTAGYTQSLMASPPTGFVINVKKIVAANTLTISGNGKNIDGAATLSVTTLNQSTMMQYDGTQWRVL